MGTQKRQNDLRQRQRKGLKRKPPANFDLELVTSLEENEVLCERVQGHYWQSSGPEKDAVYLSNTGDALKLQLPGRPVKFVEVDLVSGIMSSLMKTPFQNLRFCSSCHQLHRCQKLTCP